MPVVGLGSTPEAVAVGAVDTDSAPAFSLMACEDGGGEVDSKTVCFRSEHQDGLFLSEGVFLLVISAEQVEA